MQTSKNIQPNSIQNQPSVRRRTGPRNAATSRSPRNDEAAILAWLAEIPKIERMTRITLNLGGPIGVSLLLTNWFFVAREAKLSGRSIGEVVTSIGEQYPDESLQEAVCLELSAD